MKHYWGFFIVLIVWLGFLVLALGNNLLPAHDSWGQYQLINTFYSDYFFNGKLLTWFPYGSFGLPTHAFRLFVITPPMYFVGFLGKLSGVTNVLYLFKISIFLSILLYIFGLYILLKELISSEIIRFFIVFSALMTISWQWQNGLIFQLVYLLPYMVFTIVKLDKTNDIKWLFFLFILGLADIIGNTTYLSIIKNYSLLFIMLPLILTNVNLRQKIFSFNCWLNWRWIVLLIMLLPFLIEFYHIAHDYTNISVLRSNFSNSLKVFLNYGFVPIDTMIMAYLSGSIVMADNTYYIGLMSLTFFILGCIFCLKNRYFVAIVSAVAFLVWVSFGGFFDYIIYFFPLMKYYRHIGLTYQLTSTYMLIAAGISMQYILDKLKYHRIIETDCSRVQFTWSQFKTVKKVTVIICVAMMLDLILSSIYLIHPVFSGAWKNFFLKSDSLAKNFLFFRVFIYVIFLGCFFYVRKHTKTYGIFIIVLFIIGISDVSSYKYLQLKIEQERLLLSDKYLSDVYKMQYQPQRKLEDFDSERFGMADKTQKERLDISQKMMAVKNSFQYNSAIYGLALYTYSNYDPCYTKYRLDLLSLSIANLYGQLSSDNQLEKRLLMAIGCDNPKLCLSNNYTNTESYTENNKSEIEVADFSGDKIILNVNNLSKNSKYLIYNDAYNPNWSVSVNNNEEKIYKTDLGFKAVLINPGNSRVVMSYNNSFEIFFGVYLFIASMFLCGGLLLASILFLKNKRFH